ncbi:MAG: ATP-binding protein [Candidatus Altiarchaeota archaeon]|nr:ATP-binding protein [Candidatus Altiarchaeota archaeon]
MVKLANLADVKGTDDLVDKIRENIIKPIHRGDVGASKKAIIYGPPGCGKRFVAKVIAGELNLDFIESKAPEIKEKTSSELSNRLFFIDEIDKDFSSLLTGDISGDVFVIGSTNKPWVVTNLLQHGFNVWIFLPEPGKEARKEIIKQYLGVKSDEVDLDELAELTNGYTPVELHELIEAGNDLPERLKSNPPKNVKVWRVEVMDHLESLDKETFKPLYEWL